MTMWDKLMRSNERVGRDFEKRHLLATAMVILSQGIPFLHAGQEFYRTKQEMKIVIMQMMKLIN